MGYVLISIFPRSRLPVVASPYKTPGWHDLIRRESGDGMPSAYIRHRFDGTRYGESERLPAEPTSVGTLLLNGDYSYAAGFPRCRPGPSYGNRLRALPEALGVEMGQFLDG